MTLTEKDRAFMDAVRKLAGENPTYRYVREAESEDGNLVPVYVYEGQPSCLVAKALYAAGVPVEWLADYDESIVREAFLADEVLDDLGGYSDIVQQWACRLQERQDAGREWAKAVEAADLLCGFVATA